MILIYTCLDILSYWLYYVRCMHTITARFVSNMKSIYRHLFNTASPKKDAVNTASSTEPIEPAKDIRIKKAYICPICNLGFIQIGLSVKAGTVLPYTEKGLCCGRVAPNGEVFASDKVQGSVPCGGEVIITVSEDPC